MAYMGFYTMLNLVCVKVCGVLCLCCPPRTHHG